MSRALHFAGSLTVQAAVVSVVWQYGVLNGASGYINAQCGDTLQFILVGQHSVQQIAVGPAVSALVGVCLTLVLWSGAWPAPFSFSLLSSLFLLAHPMPMPLCR